MCLGRGVSGTSSSAGRAGGSQQAVVGSRSGSGDPAGGHVDIDRRFDNASMGPHRPRDTPCYGAMTGRRPGWCPEHTGGSGTGRWSGWASGRCTKQLLIELVAAVGWRTSARWKSVVVLLARCSGLGHLTVSDCLCGICRKLPKNPGHCILPR